MNEFSNDSMLTAIVGDIYLSTTVLVPTDCGSMTITGMSQIHRLIDKSNRWQRLFGTPVLVSGWELDQAPVY
jgi:hypothetical protein